MSKLFIMCQIRVSWLYRLETEFKETKRPQEAHVQFLIWDEVCFLNFYLFICSGAGSLLLHKLSFSGGKRGLLSGRVQYTGFSSQWFLLGRTGSRVHGLLQLWHVGSAVAAPRLKSTGSLAVAHGLSCSAAGGIFLDQGSNLCLLHWRQILYHWASPGKLWEEVWSL